LLPKNPVAGSGSSLFIVFAGLPLRSESVFFFLKKPVNLSGHLKKLLRGLAPLLLGGTILPNVLDSALALGFLLPPESRHCVPPPS
jgi:hypothetical protein